MATVRVSVSYRKEKYSELDVFASGVVNQMVDNPTVFPSMPITEAVFLALIASYVSLYGIYKQGGTGQKTAFLNAWKALIDALDLTAEYVDTVADGDEGIIIQAGFVPTKGTKTKKAKPGQMTGVKVNNSTTTILLAECEADDLVEQYVCIVTEGQPLPPGLGINGVGQLIALSPGPSAPGVSQDMTGIAIDFNKSRKKKFIGLKPGINYFFYFAGINSRGVGELSHPVYLICS